VGGGGSGGTLAGGGAPSGGQSGLGASGGTGSGGTGSGGTGSGGTGSGGTGSGGTGSGGTGSGGTDSGGTGSGGTGSGGSGGSGSGGSAGSGGTGPVTTALEITASVADCVALNNPNPDACLAQYPSELHVDVSAVNLASSPSAAYLRFDVGSQFVGATIDKVELVLRNVNGSDKSGEVHQVTPFTRPSLFGSAPAPGAVISSDVGAVVANTDVIWALSLNPGANQPFCVALTTSTDDGIGYARLGSSTPPRLRVTFTK